MPAAIFSFTTKNHAHKIRFAAPFIKQNADHREGNKLTMPIPIMGSDAFCVAASEVRP